MNPKQPPSLATIKLSHQAHLKWWRGVPMLPEEHDAMMACQGFDVMGLLLAEIDRLSQPPASG